MGKGASLRDRATRPADQAPAGLGESASVPSAVTLREHGADHIYDAEEWECSYPADMECELADDLDLDWGGKVKRVGCLKELPDLWMVNIPVEFTEDGDPDDFDRRLYRTEAEARAAYASAIEAASAGETTEIGSTEGESATAQPGRPEGASS